MGINQQKPTGQAYASMRTRGGQLGKTTVNWKQRTLRCLHLVLAIVNTPDFTRCSAQPLMEHECSTLSSARVAYSEPCRSAFRGDGDRDSELMPIAIPR